MSPAAAVADNSGRRKVPGAALAVVLPALLALMLGGCNSLFGVDELVIDGGAGGSAGATSSSTTMSGGGGDGPASSSGVGAGGMGGMGGAPQTYEVIGTETSLDFNPELNATFSFDAPAGVTLIAILVGRGTTPTTFAGDQGNEWSLAVEETNSTGTGVTAIYYTVLQQPLDTLTVTAGYGEASALTRSLVLLQANVSQLLTTGHQQGSDMDVQVTTDGTIDSDSVLVLSGVMTGFNTATTFVPAGMEEELFSHTGVFSSGAAFGLPAASIPAGLVTFMASADQNANTASVIAVFE